MPLAETARLVILDPSVLFYHAMQTALARVYKDTILHGCDETSALRAIDSNPALILIGPNWPLPEALRLCRALHQAFPFIRIVIMAGMVEELLFQTDTAYSGASACVAVTTDAQTMADTLRQVERGATLFSPEILRAAYQTPKLTKREEELLCLVAQYKTDREIADDLCMSEHTVGAHLRHIFRKLGVHDRGEAVRRARHRGWV